MKNFLINILKFILERLARLTIWRFKPDVIAISGSVGKTSAKEAIFTVLKNCYRVRKNSRNFNDELGMPLAILGNWTKIGKPIFLFWPRVIIAAFFRLIFLPRSLYPKILILEYAVAKPGDIKYFLNIAKPKVAVLTAIEDLPEAVAREKSKLIENLYIDNFAVLNFDDEATVVLKEKTRGEIMTFGFNEGADVKITNFENRLESGKLEESSVFFKLEYKGNFVPIALKGVLGKFHVYAVAVATAIGLIYGLNLVEIAEYLVNNYQSASKK
ncbi:MAG: Mur ligase family protein [Patescibacteria group bacterium]